MLNGNYGLDSIISAIVILMLGAAFIGFLIWLGFPFCRLRQKIRRAAKTEATVNSFEITKSRRSRITVPHYRYWGTAEYVFLNENGEFCDGKITYQLNIFMKKLEYGDEIKVVYDKRDPRKSVPVFLLNKELRVKIPVSVIFIILFAIIAYMMLFV